MPAPRKASLHEPDGSEAITFALPVTPTAPAAARQRARSLGASVDGLQSDLELLLTELVTNVVRHSGLTEQEQMTVSIRADRSRVFAAVTDTGRGFKRPVALLPRPSRMIGGYGLMLVDRIASHWGVAENNPTRVWFELKA